jgi:hypothetical protein
MNKTSKRTLTAAELLDRVKNNNDLCLHLIDRARDLLDLGYYRNLSEALYIVFQGYSIRKGGRV